MDRSKPEDVGGAPEGPRASAAAALRGEPVVLAFAERWRPEREARLDAIQARLRGLGAALVVVAGERAWRLRPDDEPEPLGAGAAAELGRAYGAGTEGRRPAFLLVDEAGAVRFAASDPDGGVGTTLEAALAAVASARAAERPRARLLWSRRRWMMTSAAAGLALALLDLGVARAKDGGRGAAASAQSAGPGDVEVTLLVNGEKHALRIEPRVSLLDALRERLGLTGTKKGCDAGQCGACTVLVDGRRVLSCLTLAIAAQGAKVTTIEGLARADELHPVQAAFLAHDAFQCGYCTSGQILSAVALLDEGRATTDDEVREAMSGNLCRCGAYANIVAAIQATRRRASR